jgi:aryl-alcohol dehydrogenase-like predicted oxidoreductase
LYVNSFETEMLTIVERSADAGQGTVALRPLAAGRAATTPEGPAGALAWALAKPGVSTGVVSFSSTQHLDELLGAFG